MTDLELLQYVDGYFNTHLDKTFWTGLTEEMRMSSIAMAQSDILAELNADELDSTNIPSLKAVAEQAVYLARNYENLNENKIATSENIEGISTGYTLIGNKPGISHRAVSFIKQAKKANLSRFTSFSRG
jgi:hypothetical protein